LGHEPGQMPWTSEWIRWPDFLLPRDALAARRLIVDAWERCANERVEIACGRGRGRTGTAFACVAVLEGLTGTEAVSYVRKHYDPGSIETPWQRRFVYRFAVS
jgi:protein-tyrosine phosphatase